MCLVARAELVRGGARGALAAAALTLVGLGLAIALTLSFASPAFAQEPGRVEAPAGSSSAGTAPSTPPAPAPAAPAVTPPKLVEDKGAEYPDQALTDKIAEPVTVVLVVELDRTGAVKSATVETPAGHGFDEAAVLAAQKLVFEPATRNGIAVAAKIKHKYVFTPPGGRLVGRVLAGSKDAPLAGAEVTVTSAADGSVQSARSADDGSWRVEGLRPGNYHVRVAAAGRVAQESDQGVAAAEEVSVTTRLAGENVAGATLDVDAGAGAGEIEEVRVRGVRPAREVTRRTLERREMERIPGSGGDALRALQNLPGLARPPGLFGLLLVRGSAPQDTQIFVDGTPVPIIYHFGGLSSVIPTEMLEKIDFYPGNFSTMYGRAMGGIVDVGVRDPKAASTSAPAPGSTSETPEARKPHGLVQADLIDARAMVEAPIPSTNWSFAMAGRRSWVDVWLKPALEATGAGVTTAPVYYDYQAELTHPVGKRGSFRLMFFGSDDRIDILIKSANGSDPSVAGGISGHTGFWRLQARYLDHLSENTDARLVVATGRDFVDFYLGDNFLTLDTFPLTGRAELSQKVTRGVTFNTGIDMAYVPYDLKARFPPPPRAGEPPGGPGLSRPPLDTHVNDALYEPALFSELELVPWLGSRIVPGVRLDYAKDTRQFDFGPRATVRQDLTRGFPRTTLKGGVGIFYQPPQPQETNPVFGQAGLVSNRAYHYDVGAEQELTRQVELSLDAYYKQLDRLVVQGAGNLGRGRVFGLETLLRYKPDARFFGWLAYTISRSVRQETPAEEEHLASFNQTHILTVLGSYRLGRGWELGARFRLVSGNLYTPSAYGFWDENAGTNLAVRYPVNSERLPLFHQLDIRVDKTWDFRRWKFSAYLDVQNVYDQGNVEGVSYNYNSTRSTPATGLPFLPSIGLRAEM